MKNDEKKPTPPTKPSREKYALESFDTNLSNALLQCLSASDVHNLISCSRYFFNSTIFQGGIKSFVLAAENIKKFKTEYDNYSSEGKIEDRGGELAKCLKLHWFRIAVSDDIKYNKEFITYSVVLHNRRVPPRLSELFKEKYYSMSIQAGYIKEQGLLFDVTCRFEWLQKLFCVDDIGLRFLKHIWQLPNNGLIDNTKISREAYDLISTLFDIPYKTFNQLDFEPFLACKNFAEINTQLAEQRSKINEKSWCLVM